MLNSKINISFSIILDCFHIGFLFYPSKYKRQSLESSFINFLLMNEEIVRVSGH